jgi:hypothetical protein
MVEGSRDRASLERGSLTEALGDVAPRSSFFTPSLIVFGSPFAAFCVLSTPNVEPRT